MRREAAAMLMEDYKVSERRACSVVGQHRSTYRYRSRLFEPSGLRARLREHAAAHRRWGYKKMTILLRRDGYGVNHKRVYRIYRQEKLLVHQRRRRRRCAALTRVPPARATRPNQHWAMDFMKDAAERIRGRVQITTDGHKAYLEAVERAFGMDVDYAQLHKIYGASLENETRYSPAVCIGCDMKTVSGNPDPKHVSTSFVERQNLTMRMHMRRFTRLTNGFSKKIDNHAYAVAVHFMYCNFVRIHQTLRVTPAMEARLCDHAWDLAELVSLLPN